MIINSFILTSFILAKVVTASEHGFCEKSNENCGESSTYLFRQKYIFYDVNPPEGFNLRRDVYMRFAIMLAEARKNKEMMNWNLVLPPWYNLYHWQSFTEPLPWGLFFDLKSLKSYAPVVELYELFTAKKLEIDHLYILQNYPNAFEDGDFTEKFEIYKGDCHHTSFWGYKNITAKETLCVMFQGKVSKLWELVNLHENDKYVMFAHGEIPLHDLYGLKQYWDCRKSMKFNQQLVKTAADYINTYLNCTDTKCKTYMSIHWRRGDFARSRRNLVPSIEGTANQIIKAIKKNNLEKRKIFIATDAWENEITILRALLEKLYDVYLYIPTVHIVETYKDGGAAIIEQIIASRAQFFIGTHESTYTFRIQEEREILGFDSKTTFNRFCPDVGFCEKPSKWTIVH